MTAKEWAVAREKELREQSYREAMLWEKGMEEALELFACVDPEGHWIADQQHSVKVRNGDA